jgi:glycosyltransferase involved in cell wall biosynthesis
LYSLVDALLLPSRDEGFGLPLLEAALHRIPLICPDIDPLNTLDNAMAEAPSILFPPDCAPEAIAALLWERLSASPAYQRRKAVAKVFNWTRVIAEKMEPLLCHAIRNWSLESSTSRAREGVNP